MTGLSAILRALGLACGAGLYWFAAASLCFALTGSDPIDAISSDDPAGTKLAVAATFAAAGIVFALTSRAIARQGWASVPRPAHTSRGTGAGFAVSLAKATISAVYWLAFFYVAAPMYFGDRVTPTGIAAPAFFVPVWLFVPVALTVYALWSRWWTRRID
jgi:hypothetical protein